MAAAEYDIYEDDLEIIYNRGTILIIGDGDITMENVDFLIQNAITNGESNPFSKMNSIVLDNEIDFIENGCLEKIIAGYKKGPIETIVFNESFEEIRPGLIPQGIKNVYFEQELGVAMAQHIEPMTFPDSVELIEFGDNQPLLVEGSLPPNLKSLKLAKDYSHSLRNILPPSLEKLHLGLNYNNLLEALPESLKYLHLGGVFNRDLRGILPAGLEHLVLSSSYNKSLEGVLPQGLKHLDLNFSYNESLEGVLPQSLTTLTLGNGYSLPINNVLLELPNLTNLTLGYNYTQSLEGVLPPSLTHLTLDRNYVGSLEHIADLRLTHLTVNVVQNPINFNQLPQSLIYLNLCNNLNQNITRGSLPPLLKYFQICNNFYGEIEQGALHDNIEYLYLPLYLTIEPELLPKNLKYLHVYDFERELTPEDLPKTLEYFFIAGTDKRIDTNILPSKLLYYKYVSRIEEPFRIKDNKLKTLINYIIDPYYEIEGVPTKYTIPMLEWEKEKIDIQKTVYFIYDRRQTLLNFRREKRGPPPSGAAAEQKYYQKYIKYKKKYLQLLTQL